MSIRVIVSTVLVAAVVSAAPAKLPDLSSVTAITAANELIGLHAFAPIIQELTITRSDSVWACVTSISMSMSTIHLRFSDTLSHAKIRKLLRLLQSVDVKKKKYLPDVVAEGPYYGHRRIRMQSELDSLVFHSYSDKRSGNPWLVVTGSDSLVSSSKEIHEAFDLLRPYFHQDVVDSVLKTEESREQIEERNNQWF